MSQMSKRARKHRKYSDDNENFQAGKRNVREPRPYPDDSNDAGYCMKCDCPLFLCTCDIPKEDEQTCNSIASLESRLAAAEDCLRRIAEHEHCHWELSKIQIELSEMSEGYQRHIIGHREAAAIANEYFK